MVFNSDHHEDSSSLPPFVHVDEAYWSALLQDRQSERPPRPPSNGNGGKVAPVYDGIRNTDEQVPIDPKDWDMALAAHTNDESLELLVSGYNSGGLLVTWNSLRGFVPASQLVNFPVDTDEGIRRDLLSRRIGQKLTLRIIEISV